MDRDTLRAAQAPLKEAYRADPARAWLTLRAEGRLGAGITCRVETGRVIAGASGATSESAGDGAAAPVGSARRAAGPATIEAGLHPATGGSGEFACSGDLLLQALVACAGVTMGAVATALGIELRAGEVMAEGDLDFRGTLGVDREVPVGFQAIRLTFRLDTPATDAELERLLALTERYCVVQQTLANGVPVRASIER